MKLICFILGLNINFCGYSSFVNFFVTNEGKRFEVTITKLVSKSNINDEINFVQSINEDNFSFREGENEQNENIIEPLLV